MATIHAIFSKGVFKPQESVDIPEESVVEFEPRIVTSSDAAQERVLSVLKRRFHSGVRDTAERHNEHQPSPI